MTPIAKARISPRVVALVAVSMGLVSMALGYLLHPM